MSQDLLSTVIDTWKKKKRKNNLIIDISHLFLLDFVLLDLADLLMVLVVCTFLLRCDPVYRSCLTSLNPVITLVTHTVQLFDQVQKFVQ